MIMGSVGIVEALHCEENIVFLYDFRFVFCILDCLP